jgi:hypothetical protein
MNPPNLFKLTNKLFSLDFPRFLCLCSRLNNKAITGITTSYFPQVCLSDEKKHNLALNVD